MDPLLEKLFECRSGIEHEKIVDEMLNALQTDPERWRVDLAAAAERTKPEWDAANAANANAIHSVQELEALEAAPQTLLEAKARGWDAHWELVRMAAIVEDVGRLLAAADYFIAEAAKPASTPHYVN